jgi:GNAT superfamily N-acetyltransferase
VIEVKPLTQDLMADAEALFASSPDTAGCFCMWFIIPVAQYHAGGASANRQLFHELAEGSDQPIGLLAYRDGEVVGWCAAGPRSRFARALRVPSFKGRDASEDESAWLVPCFYVRKDVRREGVSLALLKAAVEMARNNAAPAIEGFPFARGAKVSKETMVGVEAVFDAAGFEVDRRPSSTRVVMRKELDDEK